MPSNHKYLPVIDFVCVQNECERNEALMRRQSFTSYTTHVGRVRRFKAVEHRQKS